MNTTATAQDIQRTRSAPTRASRRPEPPRLDVYQPIHKALRAFMADTLLRLGALDLADTDGLQQTLAQADSLLTLVASHLRHEERFVHPMLEAAQPGISHGTQAEHEAHRASLQALRAEAAALRAAPDEAAALRLYRHFALFMAENLAHMHHEETVLNATLWARHDDGALHAMHGRLLADVDPAEKALVLRWMMPALTPAQRLAFVTALQREAPPPAVQETLGAIRAALDERAWAKLARGLGLAPVPGLVAV